LLGALLAGWGLLSLEGRPVASLGFRLDRGALRGVVVGTALGVTLGLLAVALMAAAGALRWRIDGGGAGDWLSAGIASLWMLALPAAAEEAMLRGYPLQALAEAWGAGWALVVTSIVFALLHLPNPGVGWVGLANIMGAGLFLGALFLRTGSLWWASGAHLGWNWSHAFLADLPVSGLELVDAPLVEPVLSGPAWLSGGGFGPEGSVLATVAVFAAAAWTWRGGHRLVSEES
jgi:membrane protease YdiL (CAAX protease family)